MQRKNVKVPNLAGEAAMTGGIAAGINFAEGLPDAAPPRSPGALGAASGITNERDA